MDQNGRAAEGAVSEHADRTAQRLRRTTGAVLADATQLGRVVRFSVIPYVRELVKTQIGEVDESLLREIRDLLLSSRDEAMPSQQSNPAAIGDEGDG